MFAVAPIFGCDELIISGSGICWTERMAVYESTEEDGIDCLAFYSVQVVRVADNTIVIRTLSCESPFSIRTGRPPEFDQNREYVAIPHEQK
jgi:hypothetical protein